MNATLPKILQNTHQLPSHCFGREKMARDISYLDIFITTGRLKEGVSVLGWIHEGGTAYRVLFELPDGREVFFHYSEKLLAVEPYSKFIPQED